MSCLICVWDLLWFGFWLIELIIKTHKSDSRLNHLNWFCEQNQCVQWKEKKKDIFMVFYILFEVWKPHSLQLNKIEIESNNQQQQKHVHSAKCSFCVFGKTWGWVNKSRILSLIWNMAHFLLRWWPNLKFPSKQLKQNTLNTGTLIAARRQHYRAAIPFLFLC